MSQADADAGFTLIEVLVALVILVAGLVALNQAFGAGVRASQGADRDGRAVHLAENLFAELGRSRPLRQGTFDGEDNEGQRWSLKVAPVGTGASERDMRVLTPYAVSLEVFSPGKSSSSLRFQTILIAAEGPP